MHYPILKILMKLALRLYFKRIICTGFDELEKGRPVLVLANHTNGFLDALVVAAAAKRKPYFFTRGDAFAKKWADTFLRSIGLLPVFRLSEGKDNLQRNDSTNEEALIILKKGGTVVIYPEGRSDIAKVLKPLKKGPFRLAMHVASVADDVPVIVPMGINYVHPVKPFTTLYLHAGKSIDLTPFKTNDEKEQAKHSLHLMRQMATELPELSWDTKQPEDVLMIDDLLALQEINSPTFAATQMLVGKVNGMDDDERNLVHNIWERYKLLKRQFNFRNEDETRKVSFNDALLLIVFAIPAFTGWAFHWLPVYMSKRISDKLIKDADVYASVFLSCCLLLILAWYLVLTPVVGLFFGWRIMIASLIGFPLLGAFYLKIYRPVVRRLQSAGRYLNAKKANRQDADEYWDLRERLNRFIQQL